MGVGEGAGRGSAWASGAGVGSGRAVVRVRSMNGIRYGGGSSILCSHVLTILCARDDAACLGMRRRVAEVGYSIVGVVSASPPAPSAQ